MSESPPRKAGEPKRDPEPKRDAGRDPWRDLVRSLGGEPPPERAREVEERLARDPEAAARRRRLAATWSALEPPPASPPPPGFTGRVMARVRERAAGREIAWSGAPGWLRAACAAALAAGVLAGAGLGVMGPGGAGGGGDRPPVTVAADGRAELPAAGRSGAVGGAGSAALTGPDAEANPSEVGDPGATTAAAEELAADLAEDLPAGLGPESTLTGGYWAAIGLADDLVADEAAEEPWS